MGFSEYCRELEERRQGDVGCLAVLLTTESSHTLARRVVSEYCNEGVRPPSLDLVAWEQTRGRGRRAHRWISPPGAGIYVTLVRELTSPDYLQILPQIVGVALCEALGPLVGGRCRLKWPNDLYVGARKLGGILIDATNRGSGLPVAAVSFGVNYRFDSAVSEQVASTSIEAEAGLPSSMAALASEMMAAVDAGVRTPALDLTERYAALSMHRPGEKLRLRLDGERVDGLFLGFDEQGLVRLEVEGGERRISAGEVLLNEDQDGS